MGNRRPHRLLAAASVLALTLAACGNDGPRVIDVPLPTTATPSAVPGDPGPVGAGPREPQPPEAVERRDVRGARAWVSYYWDVFEYAQASGDLGTLQRLSTTDCAACVLSLEGFRAVYSVGGEIRGGRIRYRVVEARPTTAGPGGEPRFEVVTANRVGSRTVAMPGQGTERVEASEAFITFVVEDQDGAWKVVSWGPSNAPGATNPFG